MSDKKSELLWAMEGDKTRSDRIIHRLIVTVLITVTLFFASNVLWLWAWSQHQCTSIENTNGTSNYVGGDGEINNEQG